jgi:hypothetical protein
VGLAGPARTNRRTRPSVLDENPHERPALGPRSGQPALCDLRPAGVPVRGPRVPQGPPGKARVATGREATFLRAALCHQSSGMIHMKSSGLHKNDLASPWLGEGRGRAGPWRPSKRSGPASHAAALAVGGAAIPPPPPSPTSESRLGQRRVPVQSARAECPCRVPVPPLSRQPELRLAHRLQHAGVRRPEAYGAAGCPPTPPLAPTHPPV